MLRVHTDDSAAEETRPGALRVCPLASSTCAWIVHTVMSAVEPTLNDDHPLALELSSLRAAVDRYQVKLGNLGGDITLHQHCEALAY